MDKEVNRALSFSTVGFTVLCHFIQKTVFLFFLFFTAAVTLFLTITLPFFFSNDSSAPDTDRCCS